MPHTAGEVTSRKVIVTWLPSVRRYTCLAETPIEKELRLGREHVCVEHYPVDRSATKVGLTALTEGMIEAP